MEAVSFWKRTQNTDPSNPPRPQSPLSQCSISYTGFNNKSLTPLLFLEKHSYQNLCEVRIIVKLCCTCLIQTYNWIVAPERPYSQDMCFPCRFPDKPSRMTKEITVPNCKVSWMHFQILPKNAFSAPLFFLQTSNKQSSHQAIEDRHCSFKVP